MKKPILIERKIQGKENLRDKIPIIKKEYPLTPKAEVRPKSVKQV